MGPGFGFAQPPLFGVVFLDFWRFRFLDFYKKDSAEEGDRQNRP